MKLAEPTQLNAIKAIIFDWASLLKDDREENLNTARAMKTLAISTDNPASILQGLQEI